MVARIVCVIVAALAPLSSAFMLQQPGFALQGVRAPACVMKAAALRTNDMVQVISGADKVRGAPFVWLHSAFIKPFADRVVTAWTMPLLQVISHTLPLSLVFDVRRARLAS